MKRRRAWPKAESTYLLQQTAKTASLARPPGCVTGSRQTPAEPRRVLPGSPIPIVFVPLSTYTDVSEPAMHVSDLGKPFDEGQRPLGHRDAYPGLAWRKCEARMPAA